MNDIANLDQVDYIEVPVCAQYSSRLQLVAYNIERGLRIDNILNQWQRSIGARADVILLSEVDRGMARTANRDIAREFAERLGYCRAYAVEFIELTKGERRERKIPGENTNRYIGNAILSRYRLENIAVVRLPGFFDYRDRYLARIGSRMALIADVVLSADERLTVASVHLEAHSSPAQRLVQIQSLLGELQRRDHGQPVVIGGDMNTTGLDVTRLARSLCRRPGLLLRAPSVAVLETLEPLFAYLDGQGYDYRHCNRDGATLRDRGYSAHLDWFFIKNLAPEKMLSPEILTAFSGRWRYSDHLPVTIELERWKPQFDRVFLVS